MGTFTFSWTKKLIASHIHLKVGQGAEFIGGLGYIPRIMLCIVQHVMLTCVCCVIVYLILMLTFVNMEDSISTIIERLKASKTDFLYFCVV